MTREEFLERKAEKLQALKDLATELTWTAISEYDEPTLGLFGSSLKMYVEYDDINESYIRNSLCYLLAHNIISLEQYENIDSLIIQANELHETDYCD